MRLRDEFFLIVLILFAGAASSCGRSKTGDVAALESPGLRAKTGDGESSKRFKVDRVENAPEEEESEEPRSPFQKLQDVSPEFDALHYRIALDFPAESLKKPSFDGEVQLTFRPLKESYQLLKLDSVGLEIKGIQLLNTLQTLRFEQHGEILEIDLGRPYQPRDTLIVVIQYRWATPDRGLYFKSRAGVAELETIYSQSETEESRYWFPGNARPNDLATFEAVIRVPQPFVAISNGALVNTVEDGAFRTFRWSQQKPMVSYLFVVSAGSFGVRRDNWRGIPIEFYGLKDEMEHVAYSLRDTKLMLDRYTDLIGFAYPFEKYAQVVVPQYPWGGMEHTTATTLTDETLHSAAEDEQYSSDELVSHELAHQWFGDLMTCRNWDQLWLNEGFATYFPVLYSEKKHGTARALEEMADMSSWYFEEESSDPRPIVFKYFRETPEYYFDSRAYAKGAWFLHMLRGLLGDQKFFEGIRQYVFQNQGRLVETRDLQLAMEHVSGRNLDRFFDQWLNRPGHPVLQTLWQYDSEKGELRIEIAQIQDLKSASAEVPQTPLYRGPLPIEADGAFQTLELKPEAKQVFKLKLAKAPRYLKINSSNGWLAEVKTTQSIDSWRAQLKLSSDITARVEAAQALAQSPESLESLEDCALTDKEVWVRVSCVSAMESNPKALAQIMVLATDSNWQIREAAVRSLWNFPEEQAYPVLTSLVEHDPAIRVQTAAIRSLAKMKAPGLYDFFITELERSSFQHRLRAAILQALSKAPDLRSLESGERFARADSPIAVRFSAFGLLSSLAKAYPDQAKERVSRVFESLLKTDVDQQIQKKVKSALEELRKP